MIKKVKSLKNVIFFGKRDKDRKKELDELRKKLDEDRNRLKAVRVEEAKKLELERKRLEQRREREKQRQKKLNIEMRRLYRDRELLITQKKELEEIIKTERGRIHELEEHLGQLKEEKKLEQLKMKGEIERLETEKTKLERELKELEKTTRAKRVKDIKVPKYVPEIHDVRELFSGIEKAFRVGEYDNAVKLSLKIKEIAKSAQTKALKKIEKLRKLPRPEGKYAYCIIKCNGGRKSFGNLGIGKTGEVYTIPYRDLSVVVSDSPVKEYDMTEGNLRAHERIMNQLIGNYTVVPSAFDMVFKNKRILFSVVRRAYKKLEEALKLLDNKTELGVKAILTKEAAKIPDGETIKKCKSEILDLLNKMAVHSVNGGLFSKRLILNTSFLVDKNKIKEFSEEIARLNEKYRSFLKLQYSGPWAPYNFVNIRIGRRGEMVVNMNTGKKGLGGVNDVFH